MWQALFGLVCRVIAHGRIRACRDAFMNSVTSKSYLAEDGSRPDGSANAAHQLLDACRGWVLDLLLACLGLAVVVTLLVTLLTRVASQPTSESPTRSELI